MTAESQPVGSVPQAQALGHSPGPRTKQPSLELTFDIDDSSRRAALFGTADRNLRLIRAAFDVRISARDGTVRLSGPEESVALAARTLEEMQRVLRDQPSLTEEHLADIIRSVRATPVGGGGDDDGHAADRILVGSAVQPRSEGQAEYVSAIANHDITLCLGPAGTGKTYLSVAVAVALLKSHRLKRIVLVRPAVEAGEKLGYLPGDMQAKVNPYLRPLFDAMNDLLSFDQIQRLMQNDVIEVIPLAFMRGRTLNNAAIILDEAQNATPKQMLMFLTRLGHDSKMIVTGDASQSDLADGEATGFVDAVDRLEGVPGIAVVRLQPHDIVRHPLVERVVAAYRRSGEVIE